MPLEPQKNGRLRDRQGSAVDIVTNGNEASCPWQHCNFKTKNSVTKLPSCLTQLIVVASGITPQRLRKNDQANELMSLSGSVQSNV